MILGVVRSKNVRYDSNVKFNGKGRYFLDSDQKFFVLAIILLSTALLGALVVDIKKGV